MTKPYHVGAFYGMVRNDNFIAIHAKGNVAMNIAILALQDLFDTGLFVTLDVFTLANAFSARLFGGTPHFEVSVVGLRDSVRSGQGIAVPVKPITPALKPDWVVVPALSVGT